MDGPTLKAGTKALVNYMQERAMESKGGNQPAQGGGAPIGTTTQPDGVYEKDGKHFRAQGGKVYAQ
jgi:hypothetical protein